MDLIGKIRKLFGGAQKTIGLGPETAPGQQKPIRHRPGVFRTQQTIEMLREKAMTDPHAAKFYLSQRLFVGDAGAVAAFYSQVVMKQYSSLVLDSGDQLSLCRTLASTGQIQSALHACDLFLIRFPVEAGWEAISLASARHIAEIAPERIKEGLQRLERVEREGNSKAEHQEAARLRETLLGVARQQGEDEEAMRIQAREDGAVRAGENLDTRNRLQLPVINNASPKVREVIRPPTPFNADDHGIFAPSPPPKSEPGYAPPLEIPSVAAAARASHERRSRKGAGPTFFKKTAAYGTGPSFRILEGSGGSTGAHTAAFAPSAYGIAEPAAALGHAVAERGEVRHTGRAPREVRRKSLEPNADPPPDPAEVFSTAGWKKHPLKFTDSEAARRSRINALLALKSDDGSGELDAAPSAPASTEETDRAALEAAFGRPAEETSEPTSFSSSPPSSNRVSQLRPLSPSAEPALPSGGYGVPDPGAPLPTRKRGILSDLPRTPQSGESYGVPDTDQPVISRKRARRLGLEQSVAAAASEDGQPRPSLPRDRRDSSSTSLAASSAFTDPALFTTPLATPTRNAAEKMVGLTERSEPSASAESSIASESPYGVADSPDSNSNILSNSIPNRSPQTFCVILLGTTAHWSNRATTQASPHLASIPPADLKEVLYQNVNDPDNALEAVADAQLAATGAIVLREATPSAAAALVSTFEEKGIAAAAFPEDHPLLSELPVEAFALELTQDTITIITNLGRIFTPLTHVWFVHAAQVSISSRSRHPQLVIDIVLHAPTPILPDTPSDLQTPNLTRYALWERTANIPACKINNTHLPNPATLHQLLEVLTKLKNSPAPQHLSTNDSYEEYEQSLSQALLTRLAEDEA